MKVAGGRVGGTNYRTVVLKRGEQSTLLKVAALPIGWREQFQARGVLDNPVPPQQPKMLKGGIVARNPTTKQVEYEDDFNDPEYRRQANVFQQRYDAIRFALALRDDPNVEFETPKPKTEKTDKLKAAWCQWADSVWDEIVACGFTDVDVEIVIREAEECGEDGVLVGEDVDLFLSEHGDKSRREAASKTSGEDERHQPTPTSSGD